MIAEVIKSAKGHRSARSPGNYVVDLKRGSYVLDQAHQGEKVEYCRCETVPTKNPALAVEMIAAHNAQNTRSRDPTMHIVVSFREGGKPTRDQMNQIEDRLVAALGCNLIRASRLSKPASPHHALADRSRDAQSNPSAP
jgi:hypothetical protein